MNGKQNTVMWLGLLLIFTRLFTTGQWSQIWHTLSPAAAAGTSSSQNGGCGPNADLINGKCIKRLGA